MVLHPNGIENGSGGTPKKKDYYNSGSSEPAETSELVLNRLEARRKLTKNSTRLVIVLVGLPARGKSFVARKLLNFLEWYGCECKIFNVGKYRRQANAEATDSATGACDANFFDSNNKEAAALRERVASLALQDMLRWLDNEEGNDSDDDKDDSSKRSYASSFGEPKGDRIAIFDATNSTNKRRQWILEECTSPAKRPGKPTGCVFVESICDDEELIMENFRFKISNSPDYEGMDEAEALADLRSRVDKYEAAYETITDDSLSYIKIFNLSTKLLVNHIYGRMSKVIVPALMAWNIGTRPIFLCRPGQTLSDISLDSDDYVSNVNLNDSAYLNMSISSKKRLMRGDRLGPTGKKFSDALYDFVFEEGMEFLLKRSSIMDMAQTGTSVSGLATFQQGSAADTGRPPFPIKVFTSTMPRAAETVRWQEYDFKIEELSNLNPLDKGDFAGKELEELQETHPSWYQKLERDPFATRFPGGESYKDLIGRLESVVVDLEQQVYPTLIVSHVSVLQLLIAYFRKSPVKECMHIEVPLHTVLKFTPARGGGWTETVVPLAPVYQRSNSTMGSNPEFKFEGLDKVGQRQSAASLTNHTSLSNSASPIWGDHMRQTSSLSLGASGHGHHVQF